MKLFFSTILMLVLGTSMALADASKCNGDPNCNDFADGQFVKGVTDRKDNADMLRNTQPDCPECVAVRRSAVAIQANTNPHAGTGTGGSETEGQQ